MIKNGGYSPEDGDDYISSATTWNDKQSALTFGIANTNTVKIDSADVADNEYARFTATGLESLSVTEVKTDLSLNNVENVTLSTWNGSGNITKEMGYISNVNDAKEILERLFNKETETDTE